MNIGGSYTWNPPPHRAKPKTQIPWPPAPSEFEIQSFLYTELTALGYIVRGEVGAGKSRFDLVIYDHVPPYANATEIVEVKKHPPQKKKTEKSRLDKQVKKYREFEVAITVIHGMKQAQGYVQQKQSSRNP